ncbi:MAG: thioredoxin family protein [Phycisphaerales bacterium]|nr:MAG: thioredoxin family protein [Phycisphaerales bacterium]
MSKASARNVVAVLAVVAVVAAAAWFKSQRAEQQPPDATAAVEPPSVAQVGTVADENATADAPAAAAHVASASPDAKLPRLVDLGAHKCKQCIALAPILDALREEYKGRLSVEFIDVWKNPDAARPYKIRLIPTQILYTAEGKEVWRHEGFISKEDLKALFAEKVGVK